MRTQKTMREFIMKKFLLFLTVVCSVISASFGYDPVRISGVDVVMNNPFSPKLYIAVHAEGGKPTPNGGYLARGGYQFSLVTCPSSDNLPSSTVNPTDSNNHGCFTITPQDVELFCGITVTDGNAPESDHIGITIKPNNVDTFLKSYSLKITPDTSTSRATMPTGTIEVTAETLDQRSAPVFALMNLTRLTGMISASGGFKNQPDGRCEVSIYTTGLDYYLARINFNVPHVPA